MTDKQQISIIVPVYREQENIKNFYNRVEEVISGLTEYEWKYIFVNDGSDDNSLAILKELASNDTKVRVIDLSRNFGKEIALTAGVEAACNDDAAICIDADLQHPPEIIPELIEKWKQGYEIVTAIRKKSEKSSIRNIGSHLFYWLFNRLSDTKMLSQSTDFRLLDRSVIKNLSAFTERDRMFRSLIDWMGFKKDYIEFESPDRVSGKPSYSFKRLINLAINSITNFSLLPLRLAGYLGIVITTLSSILFIIMVIFRLWVSPRFFSPLSFVIVPNTILIGIVLICLGLIALYTGHIHTEVTNRPLYIVREKINFSQEDGPK